MSLIAQHKKTIELDPSFARAHRTLSEVFRMKRDYAKVIEERARFFELIGQPQSGALIRDTFSKGGWAGYLRLITSDDPSLKEGNNNWANGEGIFGPGRER